MTHGEERARRDARMTEMIAATGYERGDSRPPVFGEQIMGIWAGESNPQRIGKYVETRRRTGRLNPGVWYRLTDGHGSFWEYEASQTLFVTASPTQEMLAIPDFLRNQDNLSAERAAQETSPVPVWPVTQHFDCHKCAKHRTLSYMIVCPTCGNKRCPKASDHELACTNSNAPGQPGSIY